MRELTFKQKQQRIAAGDREVAWDWLDLVGLGPLSDPECADLQEQALRVVGLISKTAKVRRG